MGKIIITVCGGVAEASGDIPEGVEVEIRDYDKGECAEEDECERDEIGQRYVRTSTFRTET